MEEDGQEIKKTINSRGTRETQAAKCPTPSFCSGRDLGALRCSRKPQSSPLGGESASPPSALTPLGARTRTHSLSNKYINLKKKKKTIKSRGKKPRNKNENCLFVTATDGDAQCFTTLGSSTHTTTLRPETRAPRTPDRGENKAQTLVNAVRAQAGQVPARPDPSLPPLGHRPPQGREQPCPRAPHAAPATAQPAAPAFPRPPSGLQGALS